MTIQQVGTRVKDIVVKLDWDAIGGRLQLLRKSLGLTQKEFARKLGDSYEGSLISKYETGQVPISVGMLCHICEVTGESLDWLILARGPALTAKPPPDGA